MALTLSAGVAKENASNTTDTLFKKADKALYESKENGKSAITFFKDKNLKIC